MPQHRRIAGCPAARLPGPAPVVGSAPDGAIPQKLAAG